MASPNTLLQGKNIKLQNGFTLIEVMITIFIFAVILGLGLFISFDFYKSFSFRSERDVVLSVIQKARSQSLNNIDQTRHGVHFANPLQYIIFECNPGSACTDYTGADTSKNLPPIDPAFGVTVSGGDIVFDQLSGNCVSINCATNPATITINTNGKTQTITINSQGRIDW